MLEQGYEMFQFLGTSKSSRAIVNSIVKDFALVDAMHVSLVRGARSTVKDVEVEFLKLSLGIKKDTGRNVNANSFGDVALEHHQIGLLPRLRCDDASLALEFWIVLSRP